MSRVHGKLMWRHLWLGDSSVHVRVRAETPRAHITAARLSMSVAPVLGGAWGAGKGRQMLGTLWSA